MNEASERSGEFEGTAQQSPEALAAAKLARRRAQVAASKRKRRQWPRDAGCCPECGKVRAAGRSLCAGCAERADARNGRWVKREAEKRRVAAEQARRAALPPTCTRCGAGAAELARYGTERGRQKYKCRACGCQTIGYLRRVADASAICPYCRKRCQKAGFADTVVAGWRQRYWCPSCKRSNTNLWPGEAASPGGPFPHRLKLGLNYAAREGLARFCQARKMTTVQAIRAIFAKAAEPPESLRAGHWTPWREGEIEKVPPGGVRFEDLRREAGRKMGSQTGRGGTARRCWWCCG